MALNVIKTAEFCKKEMELAFNEKFDIYEDKLVDKICLIFSDEYIIDYSVNTIVCLTLKALKKFNLGNLEKDDFGNIIDENLSVEDVERINKLIALYFIVSYNDIAQKVHNAYLRAKLKDLEAE